MSPERRVSPITPAPRIAVTSDVDMASSFSGYFLLIRDLMKNVRFCGRSARRLMR
jgi:hypothetical protein